jgi:ubiquinone/menaquinone biosynthesis C-methylase UbiE
VGADAGSLVPEAAVSTSDLFGDRAEEYARHRPTYPDALFDHLLELVERRDLAWDCGAGSGQTSRSLAGRFAQVVATDASLRQLANATAPARVRFVAAASEAAPLRDRCTDLVTVSAALHWFDRPRFYAEVRRVARPGAILAVWSYYQSLIEPTIDAVLARYAEDVVGPLWSPGMRLNRSGYRDLDFPFERLPWPGFQAQARMRLEDLFQYMRTWSASQEWQRTRGTDPVDEVRDDVARAWGDPETQRAVRWPLYGAIGRVS